MLRFCCSCSKSNHFDSRYQILSSLVLLTLEEKVLQVFLMWAPKQARSSTEPSFSAKNWLNSVGNIDRNLLLSGSDPLFSSLGLINKPLLPLGFYLNLFSHHFSLTSSCTQLNPMPLEDESRRALLIHCPLYKRSTWQKITPIENITFYRFFFKSQKSARLLSLPVSH